MTRREVLAGAAALIGQRSRAAYTDQVQLARVPENGIQPQAAVDESGVLHLLYYAGDPRHGDLFYTRAQGSGFSAPVRVNSEAGSAIAIGTIRGGQLALGKNGRAHVAWNGSISAQPERSPMLYARINDKGTAFEPQRNLMLHSFGLDGGGSVTADRAGNVYVAWHGIGDSDGAAASQEGEARRRVWITRSEDDGRSFSTEAKASSQETGACGCCGMKIFTTRNGNVDALYRSATESVHRDIYLLHSGDHGRSFATHLVQKWEINACPMSSMDFAERSGIVAAAWETGGQVFWTRVTGDSIAQPIAAPGEGKNRKHPRLAINARGETLLVWTEGTGWQRGGSFAWQVYDGDCRPKGDLGRSPGIRTWSFAAAAARPDHTFVILY